MSTMAADAALLADMAEVVKPEVGEG